MVSVMALETKPSSRQVSAAFAVSCGSRLRCRPVVVAVAVAADSRQRAPQSPLQARRILRVRICEGPPLFFALLPPRTREGCKRTTLSRRVSSLPAQLAATWSLVCWASKRAAAAEPRRRASVCKWRGDLPYLPHVLCQVVVRHAVPPAEVLKCLVPVPGVC